MRDTKAAASVTLDGGDDDIAPVEPEVSIQCPLCRVATSEKEAVDNLFLLTDSDEGFDGQEGQICVGTWPSVSERYWTWYMLFPCRTARRRTLPLRGAPSARSTSVTSASRRTGGSS